VGPAEQQSAAGLSCFLCASQGVLGKRGPACLRAVRTRSEDFDNCGDTGGLGQKTKKRPSAVPAWFMPGLTGQRGEEPQSQEDWLSIIDTFEEIARPAEPCRKHIFWTEINYRDWSPGSAGSIGYYFLYFFGIPRFISVFSSKSRIDKRNSWTYHTQYCWFASLFNVI